MAENEEVEQGKGKKSAEDAVSLPKPIPPSEFATQYWSEQQGSEEVLDGRFLVIGFYTFHPKNPQPICAIVMSKEQAAQLGKHLLEKTKNK